MKVKLFTHTDLDGIGCAILGILAFGEENIDVEYCNYDNINEKVEQFFFSENSFSKYDKVYITDISINDELAKSIDKSLCTKNIKLLDHHATALELNKYDWVEVDEETILIHDGNEKEVIEKVSGTYLFFMELLQNKHLATSYEEYLKLKSFADIVRKYDTWLWKTKYVDLVPKQWNDLFYIMGRKDFVNNMVYGLQNYDSFEFCDFDLKLLEYKQREIDSYIKKKSKNLIEKDILGYKAGVVFGEQYHSELGNVLAELNPHLDFIVIINPEQSVSYRSIGNKVHLGNDIAKVFGGGGHMNAAGSLVSEDVKKQIINLIFG